MWKPISELPEFVELRGESDTYKGESSSERLIVYGTVHYRSRVEWMVSTGRAVKYNEDDSVVFWPDNEIMDSDCIKYWMYIPTLPKEKVK